MKQPKFKRKYKPFFDMVHPKRAVREKTRKIRYVVLVGGRGSGKSFVLNKWANSATFCKYNLLFTRYTMKSAETSIIPEFTRMAELIGNRSDFNSKRTQVVNMATEAVIDYSGLKPTSNQSTGALKSISDKNVFIVEEAEDCHDFELFDKVDNSIRMTEKHNIVVLCLNQGHVNHWIYTEFIKPFNDGEREDVLVIESNYLDNLENLDQSFIDKAERLKKINLDRYERIYLNKWQTDTTGALWKQGLISSTRMSLEEFEELHVKNITDIVVAFDPGVTDEEKTEKERQESKERQPDEDGIIILVRDSRKHVYVVNDRSCRGSRSDIAKEIVGAYKDYNANFVIIEANNGGDWIPAFIKTVNPFVKCEVVKASKNKKLRAQPVQAAYEEGLVHHIGIFPELEQEMTTWVFDTGMPSPNRMDALVWGCTFLIDDELIESSGSYY